MGQVKRMWEDRIEEVYDSFGTRLERILNDAVTDLMSLGVPDDTIEDVIWEEMTSEASKYFSRI